MRCRDISVAESDLCIGARETKFNDKRGSLYPGKQGPRCIYTVREKYSHIDRTQQRCILASRHLAALSTDVDGYIRILKVNARYTDRYIHRASDGAPEVAASITFYVFQFRPDTKVETKVYTHRHATNTKTRVRQVIN